MTENAPVKKPRGPGRRFKPGQSGNPAGSRTGSRPKALLALDALGEGRASAIVDAMAERATQGDVQAASLLLARCWPVRKGGRPTPLDLPPQRTAADLTAATSAIVAAMADGTLTAEEAAAATTVLTAHRAALETADLEARIAKLENAAAKARSS